MVLCPDGMITLRHLPSIRAPLSLTRGGVTIPEGLTLAEASKRYVEATLEACDGHRAQTAERLGIGRNTVTRMLK